MVKFADSEDHPEEALTQDPPDDEELPPGDDQPEEGRAAAGAEGNYNVMNAMNNQYKLI